MTEVDREQMALTAAVRDEHMGSDAQALGWTFLASAAVGSVFIFTGWRAGSWFWVWYCLITGGIGMGCLAAGALWRSQAARDFAAVSGIMRSRVAPSLSAEELRPPHDIHHEAA